MQSSVPVSYSIPSTTQGLNHRLWPLTVLSQGLSDARRRIWALGKSLLSGVPGGEGDFLVSPLFSLNFSRYDPVVGPGGLEPGEGLANISLHVPEGFLTELIRAAFYHRCTL